METVKLTIQSSHGQPILGFGYDARAISVIASEGLPIRVEIETEGPPPQPAGIYPVCYKAEDTLQANLVLDASQTPEAIPGGRRHTLYLKPATDQDAQTLVRMIQAAASRLG
ncbi:MAG: hypothetical protein U1A05_04415 [Alphaproteobacteria bacterium]|nr:hypothetical protein [Alphaproteobacteria bacterium]